MGAGDFVIVTHRQYRITIAADRAQIGCNNKTLTDWLSVSLDGAKKMGLDEKNYEPIRELLKKFMEV